MSSRSIILSNFSFSSSSEKNVRLLDPPLYLYVYHRSIVVSYVAPSWVLGRRLVAIYVLIFFSYLLWKRYLYFVGDSRRVFKCGRDGIRPQAWRQVCGRVRCTAPRRPVQRTSLGFCDPLFDRYDWYSYRPEDTWTLWMIIIIIIIVLRVSQLLDMRALRTTRFGDGVEDIEQCCIKSNRHSGLVLYFSPLFLFFNKTL